MLRKISVDNLQLDDLQIIEDSKCCLKVNAVITKAGVYDYSDTPVMHEGKSLTKALKSAAELLKATRTARAAKLVVLEHPTHPMPVVTSQGQMKGNVEKPFFDRDKIRAQLNFDKQECSTDFLEKVRAAATKKGNPLDVSIGFYHEVDPTPGNWKDQLTGKESAYDYIMRNIVIDHVACGVPRGRCSFPNCGIGADAVSVSVDDILQGRLSRDYKTVQDCMSENKDKQNPEAFCLWFMNQIGKTDAVNNYLHGKYVQQDPWEETEEFIRSGHKEVPSEGKCRTMEISEKDGIKAVICDYGGEHGWLIQSYLFEKGKGWNKSKAHEWYNKHKSDAMPEDKLKNEFVKLKIKEGLTREQAEAQYEDLTKDPNAGNKPPAGEGKGEGEGKAPPPKEGGKREETKEQPPEPTAEQLIEESHELTEILENLPK
jgi:hypothetical protein